MGDPTVDLIEMKSVELARTLAARVAPSEYDFFDEIISSSKVPAKSVDDRALGHGVQIEEVASVSTALVVICKPLIQFIWDASKYSLQGIVSDTAEAARVGVARRISSWIDGKEPVSNLVDLRPEQIDKLIERVRHDAGSLKMERAQVDEIEKVLRELLRSDSRAA